MINNLLVLITCHMFGDYVFQNDFIAKFKSTNEFIMFVHAWLWASTISMGLMYIGMFEVWKFIFLLIIHHCIDGIKCAQIDKSKALTKHLYIDQLAHLGQLLIVLI